MATSLSSTASPRSVPQRGAVHNPAFGRARRVLPLCFVAVSFFATLLLALLPQNAFAQGVTLPAMPIQERFDANGKALTLRSVQPYDISRGDCESDIRIQYNGIQFPIGNSLRLEVWAGTSDCSDVVNRTSTVGNANSCWLVAQEAPMRSPLSIALRAQAIVSQDTDRDGRDATSAACASDRIAASGLTVALYFIPVQSNSQNAGSAAKVDIKYDVSSAEPPSNVKASPGETSVVLSWTPLANNDVLGYKFFCQPTATNTLSLGDGALAIPALAAGGASGAAGASQTTSGGTASGGTANGGTASGGGGTASSGTAGAASGGSSGATSGGATDSTGCSGSTLRPGEIPDAKLLCGTVSSAFSSRGEATGLKTGTSYTVGIATFDALGNIGPLSNVSCVTPRPLDDFYELYRQSGGNAGGGLCAFTPGSRDGTIALLSLLGLGLTIAVRRRRAR